MSAMTKKEKNAEKNKRLREKEAKRERLTNWYMINLSYGILAIIVLLIFRQLYLTPGSAVHMQLVTSIITGIFAAAAIAVFILGKTGRIKNSKRAGNYAIFLGVCTLGSLWLALYNKLRFFAEAALRVVTGKSSLVINSHWNISILIITIIAYLIISFVWYVIKLYKVR